MKTVIFVVDLNYAPNEHFYRVHQGLAVEEAIIKFVNAENEDEEEEFKRGWTERREHVEVLVVDDHDFTEGNLRPLTDEELDDLDIIYIKQHS